MKEKIAIWIIAGYALTLLSLNVQSNRRIAVALDVIAAQNRTIADRFEDALWYGPALAKLHTPMKEELEAYTRRLYRVAQNPSSGALADLKVAK